MGNYLLHQNAVVTLGRHSSMCLANKRTKTIASQIALPSTSLPCDTGHLPKSPRCQRLDGAAHGNNVGMFGPISWLVTPPVLHVVKTKANSIGPCQKWQQRSLLQLVGKYRRIRETARSYSKACGGIAQSNCQCCLCHTDMVARQIRPDSS